MRAIVLVFVLITLQAHFHDECSAWQFFRAGDVVSHSFSRHATSFRKQHFLSATSAPHDEMYYSLMETPLDTQSTAYSTVTLTRYLEDLVNENPDLQDMVYLLKAVKMACKTISNLVNRAGLSSSGKSVDDDTTGMNHRFLDNSNNSTNYADGRYYSMQRLDQLSTIVLKNALKFSGKCEVVIPDRNVSDVAEHQPGVLIAKSIDSNYVACLDPFDGSGNADASICTGTVFGVFEEKKSEDETNLDGFTNFSAEGVDHTEHLVQSVLQPGKNMKAAGYCLYSSATVLVFALGDTVQGFTLDPQANEFILTHKNLTIPPRGNVYSCNEANSEGWDPNFRKYLSALKRGTGQTKRRYAHRYVGSMVGDVHRTLLYGGLFCYPADDMDHPNGNLQLLYKIAPMAFVVNKAGGRCIDGKRNSLLNIRPERVHQKSPCFLGSPHDINELETYLYQEGQINPELKP